MSGTVITKPMKIAKLSSRNPDNLPDREWGIDPADGSVHVGHGDSYRTAMTEQEHLPVLNQQISDLQDATASASPFIKNASPFLFAVFERQTSGPASITTKMGQLHAGKGDLLFRMMSAGAEGNWAYRKFSRPINMYFLSAPFHFYDVVDYTETTQYQYPQFAVSLTFFKNTTNTDITRVLHHFHSSSWYSGYEGASLNVGTPNAENGNTVTDVAWETPHSTTSPTKKIDVNTSITIPANKTVAVVKYNTPYRSGSRGYLRHGLRLKMHGENVNFLGNGIEVDQERTLRALQGNNSNAKFPWNTDDSSLAG